MTEEFLQYIWQYRLFTPNPFLRSGEALSVLRPGVHNSNSGPDFFNAKITIGETTWAGNVEIHVFSSDWKRHNHHLDKSYDNVILHVVWRDDVSVAREDGSLIPTLELDGLYNEHSWDSYLSFMNSKKWIPCENLVATVDPFVRNAWFDRILVGRLEQKASLVEEILSLSNNDWAQAFYQLLARNMGFKLNNQAFEMLAKSLPYQFLAKHADNLFQVEAMVFGQAGLLEREFHDEYPKKLKKEYEFLRIKFSLSAVDAHLWRFMRLHPGNFPTLRLAQFAAIVHKSSSIIGDLFEANQMETYHKLLSAKASQYWDTHYVFDKLSASKRKTLGSSSIDLLIINLVSPMLVAYGRWKSNPQMIEKAVDLLTQVKPENNSFTRKWNALGIPADNAAASQALIELKTHYCDNKKCLSCRIGTVLLK